MINFVNVRKLAQRQKGYEIDAREDIGTKIGDKYILKFNNLLIFLSFNYTTY